MSQDQSPFSKLHVEEVTQAKRTLLDELGLPPKVRDFIRHNAKNIQICAVVVFLLICAWTFYDYYTLKQKNDSATLLSQAVEADPGVRGQKLLDVIEKYPSSGAAVWGRITLAHDQIENGEFAEAGQGLQELLDSLGTKSPLYSLVLSDLAQVSELSGDLDSALQQYSTLREITGFKVVGYMGEARVYEQKNDMDKARETYEKINTLKDLDPAVRQWVEAKLALM